MGGKKKKKKKTLLRHNVCHIFDGAILPRRAVIIQDCVRGMVVNPSFLSIQYPVTR